MYSDKIKLVKETYYTAVIDLFFFVSYLVIAFFICMKQNDGWQKFVNLYTTFNYLSLSSCALLILALIHYFIYKHNMKIRDDFLKHGEKYQGEIVDTIYVKNWKGQGRSRNYKLVIQYDGNKKFVTPPYYFDNFYSIVGNDCNVYVLGGKCYASDFYVSKTVKGNEERPSRVNEEEYLYRNIYFGTFERSKFIEGRTTIIIDGSDRYIMPMPRTVCFKDGVSKLVVIDICIESDKKVKVFQNFENELLEYMRNEAKQLSSMQTDQFNDLIKKKLAELLHTYYYFVKIKEVNVGEI